MRPMGSTALLLFLFIAPLGWASEGPPDEVSFTINPRQIDAQIGNDKAVRGEEIAIRAPDGLAQAVLHLISGSAGSGKGEDQWNRQPRTRILARNQGEYEYVSIVFEKEAETPFEIQAECPGSPGALIREYRFWANEALIQISEQPSEYFWYKESVPNLLAPKKTLYGFALGYLRKYRCEVAIALETAGSKVYYVVRWPEER